MSALEMPRRSRFRRAAALTAATLLTAGCTTKVGLQPGHSHSDFTDRWATADIAQVPEGTLHLLSRYELHDQVDPLLHERPEVRRTGYVVRYATEMPPEEVIDYYLDMHGDACDFDTCALEKGSRMAATCDDIAAEIRLFQPVHRQDELPEIKALLSQVTVFVTDRSASPSAGGPGER